MRLEPDAAVREVGGAPEQPAEVGEVGGRVAAVPGGDDLQGERAAVGGARGGQRGERDRAGRGRLPQHHGAAPVGPAVVDQDDAGGGLAQDRDAVLAGRRGTR